MEFPPVRNPLIKHDEYLELSWEMFGELSRALAMRVAREYQPEVVVGIARAGVIPAAIIASLLRTDFHAMTISRREGGELVRDRPEVLSAAPAAVEGKRVLLVDEVCSSGDTFRLGLAGIRSVRAADVKTATTFTRPGGYRPDFHALETDANLVFPWDRKVLSKGEWVVNPRYDGVVFD